MSTEREMDRRRFVTATASAVGVVTASFRGGPARAAESDGWGDLVGRFVYEGTPRERKKLKVEKDVDCCGKFDIRDESLMVDANGGLANVFVSVRTKGMTVCPELEQSASKKVVLDNRDCIFKPHCMTIWYTKQIFEIINSDPIAQNVAFSPFFDTPANIVLPVGAKASHEFHRNQTIPVKILCNYHPWESAYVLPRDNPYMAISKSDGTFRISKLPTGELEFQVWHEWAGYLTLPEWKRGRFKLQIKPGVNDLGTVKCAPSLFAE